MAQSPRDDARFTDEEMAEILEEASMPRSGSRATAAGGLLAGQGVTLAELRSIGEEVGIDPRRLEDAARAAVRRRGHTRRSRLLGGPLVRDAERTIEGELPPGAAPDVLALVRRIVGQRGEATEIQGSLEWHSTSEAVDRYVTVTPRDGRTVVRASTNMTGLATMTYLPAGLFGGILSVVGFLTSANAANPRTMIASLLIVPALYAILRLVLGRYGAAQGEKTERLVDEIALLAESHARDTPDA